MSAVGSGVAVAEFEDVEGVHAPAVAALDGLGVFEGTACGEGLFCPGEPVRRWTMAVWLVRVLEESEPQAGSSRFVDVDVAAWWMPYVERLADLGITHGCATEPARFCPEGPVTRAQMASFLARAFGLEAPEGSPEVVFSDVGEGVHTDSIYALAASGITVGCASEPEARFCPGRPTTRAQMASFLNRARIVSAVGSGVAVAEFEDVEGVHAPAVAALEGLGVFEGTACGEGLFCPGEPVRRWTMAVWLVRVLDESEPQAGSSRFDDVDDSEWWMPHVERLADLGITHGCATEPARFCPEDPVTRAQMASFLSRAFGLEAPEGPPEVEFSDVGEGVHTDSIYALAASGITVGCASEPEARFCPGRFTTRAQMASFLERAYSAYIGPGPTEAEPEPSGGGGSGGGGVGRGAVTTTTVTPTAVTVRFGAASHTATEGGTAATVQVILSAAPERTVTVPLTVTRSGGAATADYTRIPASVTFLSGQRIATFTVTAIDDSVDDDDESITVGFGTLSEGVTAASPRTAQVLLVDNDDPPVTVRFGAASHTATEGGTAATVQVILSAAPERTVTVPLTVTRSGGAATADYTRIPASVTFLSGQRIATFTVTAIDDSVDDDDESITVGFGTLSEGVTAASPRTAQVSLVDNDDPPVTVRFGAASHTATEGGTAATVQVILSAAPERTVTVPLTVTRSGGAATADYTRIPASVTFLSGQRIATFTVTAIDDSVDDDDESITVGFGTLSEGVTAASPRTAQVSLVDNDDPPVTVRFGAASHTATEGGTAATVQVILSAAPERTVTVPLTVTRSGGAATADYTRIPASVTFLSGQRIATFTVTAIDDSVDDDDESITVGFGTLSEGVTAASPRTAQVSLVDNDDPPVTVRFGAASHTATEGGTAATVQVALSGASQHDVSVPLVVTEADRATADDYMLPAQVTFEAGNTSATFSVTAVDDSHYDGDESITIGFGELSAGVIAASPRAARVSLVDNDHPPDITVSFGAPEYTATEGGTAATVRVELSADPERTIKVNIIAVDHFRAVKGDYVLSTASVTFDAGQTIAEFTVAAVDDSGNDDGERITLGFGYENAITLPAGVTRGSQTTTQVSLVDNDDPPRGVRFGEHFYTATEGDEDATVIQVILSEARDETVVVPLRVSARNFGASDPDFMLSGLSDMSVTFEPNETTAEFSVTAVDDTGSDDGETIEFRFGNLPSSLTVRYPTFTVVWLKDDDDPPPGPFGRDPSKDVYPLIPPGGTVRERSMEPRDLWSDGETLWLLSDKIVEYVFAYDLESSERRSDSDIPIAANSCVGQYCNQIPWPWGLWSDGEILRVLDRTRRAIFAFDLDTGVRRLDLKIAGLELSGVKSAVGMWSDGEIVWVSDIYWDKIFAFELAGGSRSSDHDIDTLKSNGVQDPTSLWSDGVTMWVIDDVDDKLYAFDLATGERKSALDFTLLAAAGNHNLHGIWSDGVTMWVADRNDNRVYAYNMPVTSALKSLSATDADFGLFQPGTANYEATVAAGTTSTTVTAQAAFSDSTVAVSYVGADMSTGTGATVPLTEGENTITITSTNGDSTHTYTLSLTVPAS